MNFFVWKNYQKSPGYVYAKRLCNTLKKILNYWWERFANTTQRFFVKRDFQKLEKHLKKLIVIRTNWKINFGWKKLRYQFSFSTIFFSTFSCKLLTYSRKVLDNSSKINKLIIKTKSQESKVQNQKLKVNNRKLKVQS